MARDGKKINSIPKYMNMRGLYVGVNEQDRSVYQPFQFPYSQNFFFHFVLVKLLRLQVLILVWVVTSPNKNRDGYFQLLKLSEVFDSTKSFIPSIIPCVNIYDSGRGFIAIFD